MYNLTAKEEIPGYVNAGVFLFTRNYVSMAMLDRWWHLSVKRWLKDFDHEQRVFNTEVQ